MDVMEWWCGDGARGGIRGGSGRESLNFQVEFFIENYM